MAGEKKHDTRSIVVIAGGRSAESLQIRFDARDEFVTVLGATRRRGHGADFVVYVVQRIAVGDNHHIDPRGADLLEDRRRTSFAGDEDEVGFLRKDTFGTEHADVADVGFIAHAIEFFARGIDRHNLRREAEGRGDFRHRRTRRDDSCRLGPRGEREQ